ncbi:MAG: HipA domain-containing protein [Verrucomicrobia bacterium]|nr:HipA domain-containing protein [Verrucomicrobiota bacterium]
MEKLCLKCLQPLLSSEVWYGLHANCFTDWFNLKALDAFQNIVSHRHSGGSPIKDGFKSSFFHGKFRKYSSSLGGTRYILKVQENGFPELPATEYVCNQIFSHLKINVPSFHLIAWEENHVCFVTRNFMEDYPESSLVHLWHFFEKSMRYDCENLLKIIGEKTGRLAAQEEIVYLVLADSLIGNNDRHGRNLGLIQTSKGYILPPFYDNPSNLGIENDWFLNADLQPAGAIWTKNVTKPTMADYIEECSRLGFAHVVDRFRENISMPTLERLVKESMLTPKRQSALLRLIDRRHRELWG